MLNYLIRRILLIFPTLLGATAVIFFVMALSPVSMVTVLLSSEGNLRPGERKLREEYLNQRYGLDSPYYVQYLRWLNNISPVGFRESYPKFRSFGFKTPDLGHSFKQSRPVWPIIKDALPTTLLLQAISLPLAYMIAIASGIWTARHRGKLQDVATGTVLLGFWSLPVIWVSVMLIGYLANVQYVRWFPAGGLHELGMEDASFLPEHLGPDPQTGGWHRGYLFDLLWHLVLPVICLTYGSFAFLSKLTRGALLEALSQDFIRTARAKGLAENVVLYRHAFRNSLMPLITVFAHILPGLIAGSVVVEKVFSVQGMGWLVVDSLLSQDRELFLSVSTIALLLQLVGFLLSDILYAVADPRVSYE